MLTKEEEKGHFLGTTFSCSLFHFSCIYGISTVYLGYFTHCTSVAH